MKNNWVINFCGSPVLGTKTGSQSVILSRLNPATTTYNKKLNSSKIKSNVM